MNLFAKYYDRLVGADYNKISEFIIDAIHKYKKDGNLVCDIGCGTATIAIELAKAGFDMIAIDSSEDMLTVAREKCKEEDIESILLLNQDICEFELYGTVDVIYSTLDTLNYILYKRDLDHIFSLVRNYLNYDGLFIFDINTKNKFKNTLGNNTFVYDEELEFCVWESEFNSNTNICTHALTFFEKSSEDSYVRYDDFQEQRYYSSDYIKKLSTKYGFKILNICDDYSNKKSSTDTQRDTYILKINK